MKFLESLVSEGKVFKAGFQQTRYISEEYSKYWKYEVQRDPFSQNIGLPKMVFPKVWLDLEGKINPSMHRASIEIVMKYIFDQPGIYEVGDV
jgi:hypothetical protein